MSCLSSLFCFVLAPSKLQRCFTAARLEGYDAQWTEIIGMYLV
jgi:hypothetical protein